MKEILPSQDEKSGNERLLRDAEHVINKRHELLKELMTTNEAVQKLVEDAERQVRSK